MVPRRKPRKSSTNKAKASKSPKTKATAKKATAGEKLATKTSNKKAKSTPTRKLGGPSALLDTRVVYCGDCLDQLRRLQDGCVDLIYIDPPFNSKHNYEVFWGEK